MNTLDVDRLLSRIESQEKDPESSLRPDLLDAVETSVQINYGAWMVLKPPSMEKPLGIVRLEGQQFKELLARCLSNEVDNSDVIAERLAIKMKLYCMARLRRG